MSKYIKIIMYIHDKFINWSTNVMVLILRDNCTFPVRLTSSSPLAGRAELKGCSDLAEYHILCNLHTICSYTHKTTPVTKEYSFDITRASFLFPIYIINKRGVETQEIL